MITAEYQYFQIGKQTYTFAQLDGCWHYYDRHLSTDQTVLYHSWSQRYETFEACLSGAREHRAAQVVHDLIHLQRIKSDDTIAYGQLLAEAWALPLTAETVIRWDTELRPRARTHGEVPEPWKAPKQALAWGMDPQLVAEAKGRRQIVQAIDELVRTHGHPLTRIHWPSPDLEHFIDRACLAIRRTGLADSFGLYTEPAQHTEAA